MSHDESGTQTQVAVYSLGHDGSHACPQRPYSPNGSRACPQRPYSSSQTVQGAVFKEETAYMQMSVLNLTASIQAALYNRFPPKTQPTAY